MNQFNQSTCMDIVSGWLTSYRLTYRWKQYGSNNNNNNNKTINLNFTHTDGLICLNMVVVVVVIVVMVMVVQFDNHYSVEFLFFSQNVKFYYICMYVCMYV